ncbi:hypothetical protein BpHYR1_016893 [Brachionus plicatilis]|uniref:Uncharacterized protein n=1 Tax=Brachionus plicatilis TaxID=10195 RepID=A0A3M7RGC3_BRAPC|nr:hypothetical protein BpHYR1_016893 [Brachionus plicatilis]
MIEFLDVKHSSQLRLVKRLNFKICLIISLIVGLVLNSLNFFFVIPNYIEPLVKYPFNLIEDDLWRSVDDLWTICGKNKIMCYKL